jgi:hypothetical protein
LTLRFNKDTPENIWDASLDSLGSGATYPTLYNDDVNVPSIMYGMRVDREAAEQYVPFGCTKFVIQGQSTGTPNVLINLLKGQGKYKQIGIPYPYDKTPNMSYEHLQKYVSIFSRYEIECILKTDNADI